MKTTSDERDARRERIAADKLKHPSEVPFAGVEQTVSTPWFLHLLDDAYELARTVRERIWR